MTWKPKNLREAFSPFDTIYAIVGLGIFQFPIGQPRVTLSLVYSMAFVVIFLPGFIYTAIFLKQTMYGRSWTAQTEENLVLAMFFTQICGLASMHALNWYHRNTIAQLVDRLTKVDETLSKLGANIDYTGVMKIGIVLLSYWLTSVAVFNVVDWTTFPEMNPNTFSRFATTTIINHPQNVIDLVSFNFVYAVRVIGLRFHELNKLIIASSKRLIDESGPYSVEDSDENKKLRKNKSLPLEKPCEPQLEAAENLKDLIQIAKHIHLELMAVSRSVERIYGTQMALSVACCFIAFTSGIYNLYNNVIDSTDDQRLLNMVVNGAWVATILLDLAIVTRSCESTSAKAQQTSELIHRIVTEQDPELREEILQFSLQLSNDPLSFSPAGLFTFARPFLKGFLGSAITHIVIIIEIDSPYSEQT